MGFSYNARYGGELYQDGKNARNAALGGLSVSYADGSNPVLLKDRNIPSIHFSHKNNFGSMARVTILSYLHPGKKYPLYLGLTNRTVDKIPNTSSACDHSTLECNYSEIDYFSQQEIGVQVSTIRDWGPYTFGVNFKPNFTSLLEYKSYGFYTDLAVLFQPLDELDVTLLLEDIVGLKYWDTGTVETVSPLFMGGLHYRFSRFRAGLEIGSRISHPLTAHFERNTMQYYHMGIEYKQQEQLFLRLGTSHANQFTAGIGIRFQFIDYSYAYLHPYEGSPFEESHIISAGINLEELHRIKDKIKP